MTHEESLYLLAGVHGTIILASPLLLFQCGSWSTRFRTWLEDVDKDLANLRRTVARELAEELEPVFRETSNVVYEVLDPTGQVCERDVNPAGSEAYHNAVSTYVERSTGKLIRWRSLYSVRQANLSWAQYLSWSILALIIIEIMLLGVMLIPEKAFGYPVPDKLLWGTFVITGVLVINLIVGAVLSLAYHNKGIKYKNENA